MECPGRRGRRGRCHSRTSVPYSFIPPNNGEKPYSLVSGIYSLFIMSCLIALVYMMLEYHCTSCSAKCNMSNITKHIEQIAQNIAIMKDNYYELEAKMSKFSQELPKLEGQIEILEALANTMEQGHFGWEPRSHLCLPNVDVFLNQCAGDQVRNCTNKCPKLCSRSIKTN